jgi:hypothetical protein
VWLQPPPVLPIPSRSGPEGPPRPFGVEPPPGRRVSPGTDPRLVAAQNRALLDGPFPRGGLIRGVSEGILLLDEDAEVRDLAVRRIRDTGASVVRIPVDWRDTVLADPPQGFEADNPANPAYRFARIDAAVLSAAAAGLTPLLVVSHAPAFAEAPHRWPYAFPGSWAPSPIALEQFAAALARRYDGAFHDSQAPGGVLPRVKLFQAWNEPNLARYLEPQWIAQRGRWSAFSPLLYRQMLNAFYEGVKSIQPADTVVAAGVAPNSEPEGVGRMAPVRFLRALLCLPPAGRRGSGRVRATCSNPPHFDVLDFHPLSVGDPDVPAPSSVEISISDAAKLTSLLQQAERLHAALPSGAKPVWITELDWESAPQSPHGVPPVLQARWISRALHRLWVAGVSLVSWQYLVDPYPGVKLNTPTGGLVEFPRAAGLYSAGPGGDPDLARPKRFLQGFTLPFDPLRVDRRHVRVWALLMRPFQRVLLQGSLHAGQWRTIAHLRSDRFGVLNALLVLTGTVRLRLLAGALASAPVSLPARHSRL